MEVSVIVHSTKFIVKFFASICCSYTFSVGGPYWRKVIYQVHIIDVISELGINLVSLSENLLGDSFPRVQVSEKVGS